MNELLLSQFFFLFFEIKGKKSVHVNILDRVILLEKHFGSIDQIVKY